MEAKAAYSTIRTALQAMPVYANQSFKFVPTAEKAGGCALGTIYTLQASQEQWMGKVGRTRGFFNDDPTSTRTRNKKDINLDAIREKIAADFYCVCSQGEFITPATCLSNQKVKDSYTENHPKFFNQVRNWNDQGIIKCLRVMAKFILGYSDFTKAKTEAEGKVITFIEHLKQYHRPPETILTDEGRSVPLLGLMELLAAGRILADTDCIGGSGDNAGWIWEYDQEGFIVAARVVKIDPGEALSFVFSEYDCYNRVYITLQAPGTTIFHLQDLKDLQIANLYRPITIFWKDLTEKQKLAFAKHAETLIEQFLNSDEDRKFGVFRGGAFSRNKNKQMPEDMADNLSLKMKEWLELQQQIYKEEFERCRKSILSLSSSQVVPLHLSALPPLIKSDQDNLTSRLISILQPEKDLLGEIIAEIYLCLPNCTMTERRNLNSLLSKLYLPFRLLERGKKELIEGPVSLYPQFLQPLRDLVSQILSERLRAATPFLKECLSHLEVYYNNFLTQLVIKDSPEERSELLKPKVQICGNSLKPSLISVEAALALLGIDNYGQLQSSSPEGDLPTTRFQDLSFKTNPLVVFGKNRLFPATESALSSFYQSLFPATSAAPQSSLLKISSLPLIDPSQKEDESIFGTYILQADDLLFPSLSSKKSQEISLYDLLEIVECFALMMEKIGIDDLKGAWPQLLAEANKSYPKSDPASLFHSYSSWMQNLSDQKRIVEFRQKGIFHENQGESRRFAQFQRQMSVASEEDFWRLFGILSTYPGLIEGNSLDNLIQIPRVLRWIETLYPSESIDNLLILVPKILQKIDHESFSTLCVGSLLSLPTNGKPQNYIAKIHWEDEQIEKFTLVSISNFRVFKPAISRLEGRKEYLELKCVLFLLSEWMECPIHPAIKEYFLSLSSEQMLLNWIEELDKQNKEYTYFMESGLLNENDCVQKNQGEKKGTAKLDIPLKLPPGLLRQLNKQIKRMQNILKENPMATHKELFLSLEPYAYVVYQKLSMLASSPLQLMKVLYRNNSIENLVGSSLKHPETSNDKWIPFHKEASSFISSLSFSSKESDLLQIMRIAQFSFPVRLGLSKQEAQHLLLWGIREVQYSLVHLMLKSGASTSQPDEAGQTPLHVLMRHYDRPDFNDQQIYAIADLLLKSPSVDPNYFDQQGSPPLLPLINRFEFAPGRCKILLEKLVRTGADVEVKDYYAGSETPLERSIRKKQPELFIELVRWGAGTRFFPQKTLEFIQQHSDYPGMAEVLSKIDSQSSSFAFFRHLSKIAQDSPSDTGFTWIGAQQGVFTLLPEVTKSLSFNKLGQLTRQSPQRGRSPVLAIHHESSKLHLKVFPEMAGVEYAVGSLHRLIIGHGTSDIELFKCIDRKGKPYPVLVSQTIEGINLHDALNGGDSLEHLDLYHLHNMILMAMLIDPEDGKPDDYILQEYGNDEGERKMRLVCVDNERCFVPAIHRDRLQVKSILYCLDQMNLPINAQTRALFLKLNPKEILKRWMNDLIQRQASFNALFPLNERKALYQQDKSHPIVISLLLPSGTVVKIYEKLLLMQKTLQASDATPLQLLSILSPDLGDSYQTVLKLKNNPLDRFRQITGKFYGKSDKQFFTKTTAVDVLKLCQIPINKLFEQEAVYFPSMAELNELEDQSKVEHLRKVALAIKKGDISLFQKLLSTDAKEKVLNLLNDKQKNNTALLEVLSQTSFHTLTLAGVEVLSDKLLVSILKGSPHLLKLDISSCPNLTSKVFKGLFEVCPHLSDLSVNFWRNQLKEPLEIASPHLVRLSLEGASHLPSLRLNTPSLSVLSLNQCNELRSFSCLSHQIDELSLENCIRLDPTAIQRFVKSCRNLKSLSVHGCDLSSLEEGNLIKICNLLMRYDFKKGSKKFMETIHSLVDSFGVSVDLENSEIGPAEVETLSYVMSYNPLITSINLSCNQIGTKGIEALAHSLGLCKSLTSIKLHNCGITAKDMEILVKALPHLTALTHLDLGLNFIGDAGLAYLAKEGLPNSLHSLDLSNNGISDSSELALQQLANRSSTGLLIVLRHNPISANWTKKGLPIRGAKLT